MIPQIPQLPQDGRILFFRRDRAAFGFLSHFHPAPFVLDGVEWQAVEFFYQAQKSPDPAYAAAIRACVAPGQAKRLSAGPEVTGRRGRQSWFKAHEAAPRPDWAEAKLGIMRRADRAKYAQNPALAAQLLSTGNAQIIEDAPHDAFWGTGRDGKGANWAGRILMEIRDEVRAAVP